MSDKGKIQIYISADYFKKTDDAIKNLRGSISDGGLSESIGDITPIMSGMALTATELGNAMVRLAAEVEEARTRIDISSYDIGLEVGRGLTFPFRESDIWGFNEGIKNIWAILDKQRAAIAPTLSLIVFLVGFVVLMEVF